MTEERLPLAELLQKAGDGDFLRTTALQEAASPRRGMSYAVCRRPLRGDADGEGYLAADGGKLLGGDV